MVPASWSNLSQSEANNRYKDADGGKASNGSDAQQDIWTGSCKNIEECPLS